MKKLLLTLAIVLASTAGAFAQQPYRVFCELLGTGKLLSSKVSVTIDFGQKQSYWTGNSKGELVDEKGDALDFNSMVDAMNFMGKRGWKFEQAYVITESGNRNVYHWLLSKEVTSDNDVRAGFQTKGDFNKK